MPAPAPSPLALGAVSVAAVSAAGAGAWLGAARPAGAGRLAGWAGALAAGVMLGVGYALMAPALVRADVAATGGAAAAIVGSHLLRAGRTAGARSATRAVRDSALHSAAEGVALGAALAVGGGFGLALAWAIVGHNAAEGLGLGARLRADGWTPARAGRAALLARGGQLALGALTVGVLAVQPALVAAALGAGFGALLYLVIAELLPEAYHAGGRTGIAVVVSLAAGLVALLGGRTLPGAGG